MPRTKPIARRALVSLAASLGLLGSSASAGAADPVTLTLYSAQHPQVVDSLTRAFTAQTGIAVRVRSGEAPEIANQIAQEGSRSPADVYFTENSPELTLLDEKELLSRVDRGTLARVPARYSAENGDWVGVLARENVLVYDATQLRPAALPHSLLDLALPAWHGKVALAPSDADFLPIVEAVVATKGRPAALAWLRGLKANAQVFDDDEGVVAAVDRGSVATGIINNYYWARQHAHDARGRSRIAHFTHGDVGAVINISGAAVLRSSPHQAAAQRFLAFLVSSPTQTMLGKSEVDFEYPLVKDVAANPLLAPLRTLQPPQLSMAQLGDDREAATLLRQAGLI